MHTAQLKLSCAYCIRLGYCSSNGPNHIKNGPNGVDFWLKTVTFWLARAPPRSGMSTKKKWKIFFFNAKMKFRRVTRHFKGVPGSPNPVSNANFTSIRAQGAILNSKKFL